jgi:hypothetical protein
MINKLLRSQVEREEAKGYFDVVLLAVGRALAAAQEFEQHARFVTWALHAAERVTAAEQDGVEKLWTVLSSTNYPKLIGPALKTLEDLGAMDADYLATLRRAKDARNAIERINGWVCARGAWAEVPDRVTRVGLCRGV